MRPKTIIMIGLLLVLLYVAAAPLGQISVDIGGIFAGIGHFPRGTVHHEGTLEMPRPPRPKRKCGACGGKGWTWEWTVDRKGKHIRYQKTCSACGGDGEV